jgi:hypothetical protein
VVMEKRISRPNVTFLNSQQDQPKIERKRHSQIAFMPIKSTLFPEKKLRDKTEEVRERRIQRLLDEDEFARKKQVAIQEKLK